MGLNSYHIAREVYFVQKGYKDGVYYSNNMINKLKPKFINGSLWYFGRIKNKRFKLPADPIYLALSIDEYSRKFVVPMLLEKNLIKVIPV